MDVCERGLLSLLLKKKRMQMKGLSWGRFFAVLVFLKEAAASKEDFIFPEILYFNDSKYVSWFSTFIHVFSLAMLIYRLPSHIWSCWIHNVPFSIKVVQMCYIKCRKHQNELFLLLQSFLIHFFPNLFCFIICKVLAFWWKEVKMFCKKQVIDNLFAFTFK